jgi:hypothetical protein
MRSIRSDDTSCAGGKIGLGRLTKIRRAGFQMPTLDKLFPTQRLLQIILVLGATVIMKLLS